MSVGSFPFRSVLGVDNLFFNDLPSNLYITIVTKRDDFISSVSKPHESRVTAQDVVVPPINLVNRSISFGFFVRFYRNQNSVSTSLTSIPTLHPYFSNKFTRLVNLVKRN